MRNVTQLSRGEVMEFSARGWLPRPWTWSVKEDTYFKGDLLDCEVLVQVSDQEGRQQVSSHVELAHE